MPRDHIYVKVDGKQHSTFKTSMLNWGKDNLRSVCDKILKTSARLIPTLAETTTVLYII